MSAKKAASHTSKRVKRVSRTKNTRSGFIQFDPRIIVGIIGLILSVVLHELFHIAMHWGHIVSISFFSKPYSIMEVVSVVPYGYDTDLEETVAYSITIMVMLITIVIIGKIHDQRDKRTFSQILLPRGSKLYKRMTFKSPTFGRTASSKTLPHKLRPRAKSFHNR